MRFEGNARGVGSNSKPFILADIKYDPVICVSYSESEENLGFHI